MGPTYEYKDGVGRSRGVWYIHGKMHRTDGPALERPDGVFVWSINNIEFTKERYVSEVVKKELNVHILTKLVHHDCKNITEQYRV